MKHPIFVVGVDGSPASRSALSHAFDEVSAHGGQVRAVICWSRNVKAINNSELPPANSYENASQILHSVVFEESGNANELRQVVREITEGDPGPALIAASRHATALLIGATNEGTISRLTHHSVSDYCLRHAHVPVTVVPYVPHAIEDFDHDGESGFTFEKAIDRAEMATRL